jgi:1,4-dihydroxy-2-naphthoate octaprenyltransferase
LWLWPFLAIVSISMYGELFNELRDLKGDLEAGVKHTASIIGERATQILANALLIIGIVAFIVTLFVVRLVPLWVLILMALLAAIMTVPPMIRARTATNMVQFQTSFQMPIQTAGAIAMLLGSIVPWLNSILRLGLF